MEAEIVGVGQMQPDQRPPRHSAWLEGVAGRLRLEVGERPVAVLEIRDGDVEVRRGGGDAEAVAICDDMETLTAIVDGELNPVVAALQDRLQLRGDLAFGIDVILGLQAIPRPHGGARRDEEEG